MRKRELSKEDIFKRLENEEAKSPSKQRFDKENPFENGGSQDIDDGQPLFHTRKNLAYSQATQSMPDRQAPQQTQAQPPAPQTPPQDPQPQYLPEQEEEPKQQSTPPLTQTQAATQQREQKQHISLEEIRQISGLKDEIFTDEILKFVLVKLEEEYVYHDQMANDFQRKIESLREYVK